VVMSRWVMAIRAVPILLIGCTAPASLVQVAAPTADGSVDHPPTGAYQALVAFVSCMRQHQVRMPEPVPWSRRGRLIVYYPPHNLGTAAAYRACDHFRTLAKQQGGPH
jgi:hypothetical protein